MKKTLCILVVSLTASFANIETSLENTPKITTINASKIIREVRTYRIAPKNREVAHNPLPLTRLNRELREERFMVLHVRESRKVRYIKTQTDPLLASLK